jgi:hypothetical protein
MELRKITTTVVREIIAFSLSQKLKNSARQLKITGVEENFLSKQSFKDKNRFVGLLS